jgi:hypothetical protein
LDENLKIAIIETLDLLVLGNLQICKFLEIWIKMLCSIYHQYLAMDRRHAYESCGKKIVQKRVEVNE